MAENILGLLLVANSSKERYIFRYPPDATSPLTRLSNPIYAKETITAKDPVPDRPQRLFEHRRRRTEARLGGRPLTLWSSNASGTSQREFGRPRTIGDDSEAGSPLVSLGGSIRSWTNGAVTDASSSSSSSGSDSDSDGLFDVGPMRRSIRSLSSGTDTSKPGTATPGAHPAPKPFTEIVESDKTFRRHSTIDSDVTAKERRHHKRLAPSVIEAQYNTTLGYSLDFLADLLSPPRSSCHKKFEVTVDEIVFIGHPVCCGPDGKWTFPSDEDSDEEDARRVSRGRRMNDSNGAKPAPQDSLTNIAEEPGRQRSSATLSDQMEVLTTPESSATVSPTTPPARRDTIVPTKNGKDKEEDDIPQLQMFHLVLIVDKPDPRPGQDTEQMLEQIYREVAFKWSAAAFAMQVRENWVARQARDLARIREKGIQEGIPVDDCLRECIEKTALARSLHEIYGAVHNMKMKPVNTLFQALPVTATVNVANIPITIVFPPRKKDDADDAESSESSDSDDEWHGLVVGPSGELVRKMPEQDVHPWQTLLILEDDDPQEQREPPVRRDSRSGREEDEIVRSLIRACDISKPLHEIAHLLRYDLEGIVIPLVRELIQNRRAILVDVVNVRLRTILAPTSVSEHVRSLAQHSIRFQFAFPTLPPLLQFISMISLEPVPFRDLLPPEAQADVTKRDPYLRAITWLLKNDLVRQVHVYARVIASSAVKEAAWRKLWQRRRARWLRAQRARKASHGSSGPHDERPPVRRPSMTGGMAGSFQLTAPDVTSPKDIGLGGTPRGEPGNPLAIGTGYANRVPRSPLVLRGKGLAQTAVVVEEAVVQEEEDYDSELEMDSDLDGDGDGHVHDDAIDDEDFELQQPKKSSVPKFASSFIVKPAKAQKDEQRWLRIIRETVPDPIAQSRFDLCVQYFDGATSFEEIMYRTSLSRREVDRIAYIFRDHVMTSIS